MVRVTVSLALCVMLGGCAFAKVQQPDQGLYRVRKERSFEATPSQMVQAMKRAYEKAKYSVDESGQDPSMVISKNRDIPIIQGCDCGSWNGAKVYGTANSRLVASLGLEADTNSIRVTLDHQCTTNFTGTNIYGAVTRRESYRCATTNKVESDIWTAAEEALAEMQK